MAIFAVMAMFLAIPYSVATLPHLYVSNGRHINCSNTVVLQLRLTVFDGVVYKTVNEMITYLYRIPGNTLCKVIFTKVQIQKYETVLPLVFLPGDSRGRLRLD